jgi:DNA-binding transcriptional ArsR family regulator
MRFPDKIQSAAEISRCSVNLRNQNKGQPCLFTEKMGNMEKIDYETGEIITVYKKGLWSHFPIPAYQVLAAQKERGAQKLLTCLVSFLGRENTKVFPSYIMISKTCGMSPNSIRKALTVLEDNGFVKTFNFKQGKKERNIYYLQESCWDTEKMNK